MGEHNTPPQGPAPLTADTATHAFISRWQHNTASELSTAQSFVMELCALRRAAEEAAGTVRWLRPAFQNIDKSLSKSELPAQVQQGLDDDFVLENSDEIDSNSEGNASAKQAANNTVTAGSSANAAALKSLTTPAPTAVQPWPATLPEQVRAVAQVLASSPVALSLSALESHFKGRGPWKKGLPMLLQTLEALGRAQPVAVGDAVAWRA